MVLTLAIVGALGTVIAIVVGLIEIRGYQAMVGRDHFAEARHRLEVDRWSITRAVAALYETAATQLDGTLMLAKSTWIPSPSVPLDEVEVLFEPPPAEGHDEALRMAQRCLPRGDSGERFASYVDAIRSLEPETQERLFRHTSYRLRTIGQRKGALRLGFSIDDYFSYLNTVEVLAYEAASWYVLKNGSTLQRVLAHTANRYRTWVGDPFDLHRRCVTPGVSTLTVRKAGDTATFFMHRREAKKVAVAGGSYHVVPAGEFQPSDVSESARRRDLDLWRNIVREYAEEFLNSPEAGRPGGREIDFKNDEPFASVFRAHEQGGARPYFLAYAVDPLTLKGAILTACVWDAATFDRVFAEYSDTNSEGTLIIGSAVGIPFDRAEVNQYLQSRETLPEGKACLQLAWANREVLLADPATT